MVNYFVVCQISATNVNYRNKETMTNYNACFLMHFNLEDFFRSVNFIDLELWARRGKTVFPDKEKIHMYWFDINKQNYSKISSRVQGAKESVVDTKKSELEWVHCVKKNNWTKYNLLVPKIQIFVLRLEIFVFRSTQSYYYWVFIIEKTTWCIEIA